MLYDQYRACIAMGLMYLIKLYFSPIDILYFLILDLAKSWKYLEKGGSGACESLCQRCTIFETYLNRQGNDVPRLVFPNAASQGTLHLLLDDL